MRKRLVFGADSSCLRAKDSVVRKSNLLSWNVLPPYYIYTYHILASRFIAKRHVNGVIVGTFRMKRACRMRTCVSLLP